MSGTSRLKDVLGGPWNASKQLQTTGVRAPSFHLKQSDIGPPLDAIPSSKPLARRCSSPPRKKRGGKAKGTGTVARKTKLRRAHSILCFGDSLTYGFRVGKKSSSLKPASYSLWLEKNLIKESKRGKKVIYRQWSGATVTSKGVSGETVSEMKSRLTYSLGGNKEGKARGKPVAQGSTESPYSIIVLLGGTNDLCTLKPAEEIIESIFKLTSAVATLHIPLCVLCTIPELGVELTTPSWRVRREKVNDAIRAMNEVTISPQLLSSTRIIVCDLAQQLPPQKGAKALDYWCNDGVHMTKKGYEAMGKVVFRTLIETSTVTKNEQLYKQKQERMQKKEEQRLRKRAKQEEEDRQAARLKVIQDDAIKKRKEEAKAKAWEAGAPSRAAKAKRLADEAWVRNEAKRLREEARQRKLAELEREKNETENMEEEDRLVRLWVRQEKKRQREEEKLLKVDDVIIAVVKERIYITRKKLIASLFGRLKFPVPGKVLKARIYGLLETRKMLQRDSSCPEIILHQETVEKFLRVRKEKEDAEAEEMRLKGLEEMKKMAESALENSKIESYAEKKERELREKGIVFDQDG